MTNLQRNSSIVALFCLTMLSACGGGGGESASAGSGSTAPSNGSPVLTVTPVLLNLESGKSALVSVSSSDDDGAPVLSLSNISANLTAQLSGDGKLLTLTAGSVSLEEKGSLTIIATENNTAKKQTTRQIDVNVFPKINLYALINGVRQEGTLTAEYARPLSFRVVDENNSDIPFSNVMAKDPAIVRAEHSAGVVTLTALKAGATSIEIAGTSASGQRYLKTFDVTATGNQQPSLSISPAALTLQESTTAQLTVAITDPDGSAFQQGVLSARSSEPGVVTVSIKDGNIVFNGIKTGSATVTVSLQDAEFTVTASIAVTVIPEALPVLSINQNMLIELEETDTIAIPIDIVGPRAAEYKPSVKIDSVNGQLSDLSYSVVGNTLNITAGELKNIGSAGLASYKVTASATNGKHTLTSAAVGLDVWVKTNAGPIFEFANKFGKNVMIKSTGVVTVNITVNDDNAKKVVLFEPEPWMNESKAGTYTVSYDDTTRQLSFTLSGFERNERFGIMLSYKDGMLGGKFSTTFRTSELTELDLAVLEARKAAIAQVEAAKSYQLITRLYAEYLENAGVVDAQYVDDLYDQIRLDDTENSRLGTTEFYINDYMEKVYSNEVNQETLQLSTVKATFENLLRDVQELNKNTITTINEMADKSNGYFPRLSFENTVTEVAPLSFSKFYGKAAYGSIVNGKWQYAPAFRFLAAIDAKVAENTGKRLQ